MYIGLELSLSNQTYLHFCAGNKGLSLCLVLAGQAYQRTPILISESNRVLQPGFKYSLSLVCFCSPELGSGVCDHMQSTGLSKRVRVMKSLVRRAEKFLCAEQSRPYTHSLRHVSS